MINNLVFDLGNVLIDYDPSRIVRAVFKDSEVQSLMLTEVFQSESWRLLDQGLLTFEEHDRDLSSRYPQHAEKIKWILKNWYQDQPLIPGIYELLGKLKVTGFQLYILSNANSLNYSFQDYSRLFNLFHGITFSSNLHLLKPQVEIYERFTEIHSLVPSECLFIDDKKQNIEGAKIAGWQAHQFIGVDELTRFLEKALGINLNK